MPFTRRAFLHRMAAGAAASTILQLPLTEKARAQARRTAVPAGAVRLHANENAYGPLPSALRAMQDVLVDHANRYPFNQYDQLVEKIASYNKVDPKQIVIGTGSTEPMRNVVRAFCTRGKNIVVADPTFEGPEEFAAEVGAEVRKVPLTRAYAHDLDAMLHRADANTALVYVCSPNNPTSPITPTSDVETFISKLPPTAIVIHDEAYFHWAMDQPGYRSLMDRISDRLIILRSFSKIYGMAGMRLGYTVSTIANAEKMAAARVPITVSIVTAAGGTASLDNDLEMIAARQRNAADRAEFLKQAAARKLVVIPPTANFVMLKGPKPAAAMIAALRDKNVLIGRLFPRMPDFVRVTLGLPADMQTFWTAWDQVAKRA